MSYEEPRVTINGTELAPGQAMTVRVAITEMLGNLSSPYGTDELGDDEHRPRDARRIHRALPGAARAVRREVDVMRLLRSEGGAWTKN